MAEQKDKTKRKPQPFKKSSRKFSRKTSPDNKGRMDGFESNPLETWKPVTKLGKMVKGGEITDIKQIFDQGYTILESEIVDTLLPNLGEDLLLIGQAKGKFGGGQRRIFRQTQKKTREGNKIHFMTCAVVGNRDGYVGISTGKSKETVPARDKAKRKARLNLIRVRRGCGSWETDSREPNSIPFAVEGKCGSVRLKLMPAPRGKGLCIEKECAKVLELAGIKDIWSKAEGKTNTKLNLIFALEDALRKLSEVKVKAEDLKKLGIIDGKMSETVGSES
ncbi:MAG TPA: 30S ribosomal protein S5 [Candidatus Nanoarchaeia archaeon]|nr:30S ribosomal protein S5 [Candidatus Nanoarchaeia archaeon]